MRCVDARRDAPACRPAITECGHVARLLCCRPSLCACAASDCNLLCADRADECCDRSLHLYSEYDYQFFRRPHPGSGAHAPPRSPLRRHVAMTLLLSLPSMCARSSQVTASGRVCCMCRFMRVVISDAKDIDIDMAHSPRTFAKMRGAMVRITNRMTH